MRVDSKKKKNHHKDVSAMMTNKPGLQRQTATTLPGPGQSWLELGGCHGVPPRGETWLCFALGSSFLWFQRIWVSLFYSQKCSPRLFPQNTQFWLKRSFLFQGLWSAMKRPLWCLQALFPAHQQSSQLLSLHWIFFFKGKTNKRDTTTNEVLVSGTRKRNSSSSCHQTSVFFTESYRNLCPVPSAMLPSVQQLPQVKRKKNHHEAVGQC